jgi:hypothetical protein
MIAVVSLLMGVQFLLAFTGYDVAQTPRRAIHRGRRHFGTRTDSASPHSRNRGVEVDQARVGDAAFH